MRLKEEISIWKDIVIRQIVNYDQFGINQVHNLKTVRDLYFDSSLYPAIFSLVESHDWKAILKIDQLKQIGFHEYLSIVTFSDETNRLFAATIYDNDNLWQDPTIIDLIQI